MQQPLQHHARERQLDRLEIFEHELARSTLLAQQHGTRRRSRLTRCLEHGHSVFTAQLLRAEQHIKRLCLEGAKQWRQRIDLRDMSDAELPEQLDGFPP